MSPGIAFVAVYMLMLQALVGAFVLGSTANASSMLDAFGNPLCITSADGAIFDGGDTGHAGLPECCTSACSMFAPLTVEDRTPHSLDNPLPFEAQAELVLDTAGTTPTLDHDPGSPRAPPLAG